MNQDVKMIQQMMNQNKPQKRMVEFGVVDAIATNGRPIVKLDGRSLPGTKAYQHLTSYTPMIGDDVMIISNVVIGKIVR